MTPAEFFSEHWDAINIQTAILGTIVLAPVAYLLFKRVASHALETLKSERSAHIETKNEKDGLESELLYLQEERAELKARLEGQQQRDAWRDADLTDKEEFILVAISMDRMNDVYRSKKITNQRISLAQDRLRELGLAASGIPGHYATKEGRKWLDEKGLLK